MRTITKKAILINNKTFEEIREDRAFLSGLVPPSSFKDLFGDLSDSIFQGNLDLSGLNLDSLKGCPLNISGGYFCISNNRALKSLDYFPEDIDPDYGLFLDYDALLQLDSLDMNIYKNLHITLFDSSTHLDSKEVSKNIVKILYESRRINGNFNKVTWPFFSNFSLDYHKLEIFYSIFEKVGFDREKFDRALELL